MNFPHTKVVSIALVIIAGMAIGLLSCGEETTGAFGFFDVYGRVVYRPVFYGSIAEFYVYNNGAAVSDAVITVDGLFVPLVDSAEGYYGRLLDIAVGDTLEYSVDSEFGFSDGNIIIPDTVAIIRPAEDDTLLFGADFTATWRRAGGADGYYVYLENQLGFVAAVTETYFDTTVILSGGNFIESGIDIFWVEVLNGSIIEVTRPDGRRVPQGVVGAAGKFRNVYVDFGQ